MRAADGEAGDAEPWTAAVYGLRVEGRFRRPPFAPAGAAPSGRTCTVGTMPPAELRRHWPSGAGEVVGRHRTEDGRVAMSVLHDPQHGFRLAAAGTGACIVAADGRSVLYGVRPMAPPLRLRLLFAQALPAAAVLQGLEVLHACAVRLPGREEAIAVLGARRMGKTSVGARLLAAGGTLLTDDVLAVEVDAGGGLLGHPGPGVLALRANEAADGRVGAFAADGAAAVTAQRSYVPVQPCPRPLRVATLYVLERTAAARALRVVAVDGSPFALLAANRQAALVETPARAVRRLDVAAALAGSGACRRVEVPEGRATATDVAAAILADQGVA